ncbi:MAG: hypothetical protein ABSC38_07420 [Verrucomicrobiia bacterium]
MDITFACKKCGQSIVVDEASSGQLIDCPNSECHQPLTVPSPEQGLKPAKSVPVRVTTSHSDTKRCPFCAEEILVEAIKCKHCGEFLNGAPTGRESASAGRNTDMTVGKSVREILCLLLLLAGVGGIIIMADQAKKLAREADASLAAAGLKTRGFGENFAIGCGLKPPPRISGAMDWPEFARRWLEEQPKRIEREVERLSPNLTPEERMVIVQKAWDESRPAAEKIARQWAARGQ